MSSVCRSADRLTEATCRAYSVRHTGPRNPSVGPEASLGGWGQKISEARSESLPWDSLLSSQEQVSAQGQPEKLFVCLLFMDACKNLSLGIPPSTDQQTQVKELALKTPFVSLHGLDVAPWKAGWNQTHNNLVVQAEESILSCWSRLVILENFQDDV